MASSVAGYFNHTPSRSAPYAHLDNANTVKMGQRQNRKRVRHRPNRARKYFNLPPLPIQPNPFPATPTAASIRYSYVPTSQLSKPPLSRMPSSSCGGSRSTSTSCQSSQEDSKSRDIRIFGGLENEADATDLRGPMLDVVLGLFNGIDYDDALC